MKVTKNSVKNVSFSSKKEDTTPKTQEVKAQGNQDSMLKTLDCLANQVFVKTPAKTPELSTEPDLPTEQMPVEEEIIDLHTCPNLPTEQIPVGEGQIIAPEETIATIHYEKIPESVIKEIEELDKQEKQDRLNEIGLTEDKINYLKENSEYDSSIVYEVLNMAIYLDNQHKNGVPITEQLVESILVAFAPDGSGGSHSVQFSMLLETKYREEICNAYGINPN